MTRATRSLASGGMPSCAVCEWRGRNLRILATSATFRPCRRYGSHQRNFATMLEYGAPLKLDAGALVCSQHQPLELEALEQRHREERAAFLAEYEGFEGAADFDKLLDRQKDETPEFFVRFRPDPAKVNA